MKKTFAIAGVFGAAILLGSAAAVAQGNSATQGANPPMFKAVNEMADESVDESVKHIEEEGLESFARADMAASRMRGFKGRNGARNRGANKPGFCPPGQKKKVGSGSRFRC